MSSFDVLSPTSAPHTQPYDAKPLLLRVRGLCEHEKTVQGLLTHLPRSLTRC